MWVRQVNPAPAEEPSQSKYISCFANLCLGANLLNILVVHGLQFIAWSPNLFFGNQQRKRERTPLQRPLISICWLKLLVSPLTALSPVRVLMFICDLVWLRPWESFCYAGKKTKLRGLNAGLSARTMGRLDIDPGMSQMDEFHPRSN